MLLVDESGTNPIAFDRLKNYVNGGSPQEVFSSLLEFLASQLTNNNNSAEIERLAHRVLETICATPPGFEFPESPLN